MNVDKIVEEALDAFRVDPGYIEAILEDSSRMVGDRVRSVERNGDTVSRVSR